MIAIKAHYDGKFIVPDEPVDLPPVRESALAWLAANASDSTAIPSDFSHQHDHYLYGTPKRDV